MAAPRKDNVKDIILDTTEFLLINDTIDNISLANIATSAGISKGTLYYHYKAKEDILLDITDRYLEQQWNDFIKWTENKEKDTSIHRLVKYVIERAILETGPRMHLIYNACVGNKELQDKLIERYNKFQKIISAKVAERIQGIDPEYIAWLVMLISDGIVIQSEIGNSSFKTDSFIKDTEKYVKQLTALFGDNVQKDA